MAEGTNPASGSDKQPSMPAMQAAHLNQDSKNVFTELFGKEAAQGAPILMNTVAAGQEKKSSFFGTKPKEEPLTLKKLQAHPSKPGDAVLKAAVTLLFIVIGLSASQNSTHFSLFGVNAALQVEQAQDRVDSLKAEVLFQSHLEAALLLDQYLGASDEYFYNAALADSVYTAENTAADAVERMQTLEPELVSLLGNIQQDFGIEASDADLVTAQSLADAWVTSLSAKQGTVDEEVLLQEIQDVETAKNLLSQTDFKNTVLAMDLTIVTDADFEKVYTDFSSINASVTALISKIKNNRVDFASHLDELEMLTKSVDPLFNTEFTGSLTLEDVRFSSDGSVTVAGATTTDDSKNFTLISDLMDSYEESDLFKDAQNRTYAKSGESEEDGYTGNFRIDLTLE